jgi:hypothetical protein
MCCRVDRGTGRGDNPCDLRGETVELLSTIQAFNTGGADRSPLGVASPEAPSDAADRTQLDRGPALACGATPAGRRLGLPASATATVDADRVDRGDPRRPSGHERLGEIVKHRQGAGRTDLEHVGVLLDVGCETSQGDSVGDGLVQHSTHQCGIEVWFGSAHSIEDPLSHHALPSASR